MRATTRFAGKMALFASLQLVIVGGFVYKLSTSDAYVHAWADKQARVANKERGPALIVVGGSNAAFGLNTSQIAEALHLAPMNLAVHAGLGTEIILSQAEEVAREGDTILLSLEGSHWRYHEPEAVAAELLVSAPSTTRFLAWSTTKTVLDEGLSWMGRLIKLALRGGQGKPYLRSCFNEAGDVVCHLKMKSPKRTWPPSKFRGPTEAGISRVQQFQERMTQRGVKVAIVFPPLPQSVWPQWQQGWLQVEEACIDHHWATLAPPAALPDDHFFDTIYHLNAIGRARRTTMIQERIGSL